MRRFILIYIICMCAGGLSAQSLSDYLPHARTGDAVAQYNTAQCYLYGWGTKPDKGLWLHFLRLSAEGGEPRAASDLARHLSPLAPDIATYWRGEHSSIPHDYIYRSYNDGCYYGELLGGTRDGLGTFVWDNGVCHTGCWENGERYGLGITRFADLVVYGDYAGNLHNYGAIIVTAPDRYIDSAPGSLYYVGYFEGGLPNGVGTLYDRQGNVTYYGEFSNGKPSAPYPSLEAYTSYRWVREELPNGDIWEGEMVDGVREGFGIYRWGDGSSWWGFWHEGLREGSGLYVRNDGALMSGTWTDGELNEER